LKNLKIQTGTGSNWPVSVRFGSVFLSEKPENLYYCFLGLLGFFGLLNGLSDGLVINVNII
jgi:hypothetical protein